MLCVHTDRNLKKVCNVKKYFYYFLFPSFPSGLAGLAIISHFFPMNTLKANFTLYKFDVRVPNENKSLPSFSLDLAIISLFSF